MKEDKLMQSLFRLLRLLKIQFDQNLKDREIGLNGMQIKTLKAIQSNHNCTTQTIANMININKAQVTPLVKELIKRGFVTTKENSIDKRSHFLLLTDASRDLLGRLEPTEHQIINGMIRGLNNKELDDFIKKLNLMADNLESVD